MKILSNLPLPHPDDCELLLFDNKPDGQSSHDPRTLLTLSRILDHLPTGWIPDAVILKSPYYYPMPLEIERCPFPTIALLDDWFGGVDYLPDNLRRVDYIFTDRTSLDVLAKMGFSNVGYGPLFGFDPGRFRRIDGLPRMYDVTFTGSFNSNIQTDRLPYLRRLAELDKRFHIRLCHSLWGDEYVRVLSQSKIVFNRTIKGEMNMRAFEAPACGALLFIEEENKEIRDFLEPGRECVCYNDHNFEDLLTYYLEHEDQRASIAEAGWRRIQDFSGARLFSQLCDSIRELRLRPGVNRQSIPAYHASAGHRDFVQVSLSLRGRAEGTIEKIQEIVSRQDCNPMALNDCAVIMLVYLEDRIQSMPAEAQPEVARSALALCDAALTIAPGYPVVRFNRAQALCLLDRADEAIAEFAGVLQPQKPLPFEAYKGLTYPVHYNFPLRHRWSGALLSTVPREPEMAASRQRVLAYAAALCLGGLYEKKNNITEAAVCYRRAAELLPDDPAGMSRYAMISEVDKSDELFRNAMNVNPFAVDVWQRYLRFLFEQGRIDEGKEFLDSCMLCLSRLQMTTKDLLDEFELFRRMFEVFD
jgi:tetratricopeptide (TPR) repeat protein